jgi:hypothetical protein
MLQASVSSSAISAAADVAAAAIGTAAKPARIAPIPYDERQSLSYWTASDAETRTAALWLAIAPILSAYLINGGTAAALKGTKGQTSKLAAHIHETAKGKRNAAARAVFALALKSYKPRACEYSQEAHDEAIEALELAFMAELAPKGDTARKPAAKRYTIKELADAIGAGSLSAEELAVIVAAIPPSALGTKPAAVAAQPAAVAA